MARAAGAGRACPMPVAIRRAGRDDLVPLGHRIEALGGEDDTQPWKELPDERGSRSEQHIVGGHAYDGLFTEPCEGPAAAFRHVPSPRVFGGWWVAERWRGPGAVKGRRHWQTSDLHGRFLRSLPPHTCRHRARILPSSQHLRVGGESRLHARRSGSRRQPSEVSLLATITWGGLWLIGLIMNQSRAAAPRSVARGGPHWSGRRWPTRSRSFSSLARPPVLYWYAPSDSTVSPGS